MNKEMLSATRYRVTPEIKETYIELHHRVIKEVANASMQNIGLVLDFNSDGLTPASIEILRKTMRNMLVIKNKNELLKEYKP